MTSSAAKAAKADRRFREVLRAIEASYSELPKSLRIRTEHWCTKLAEECFALEWKKNRNRYAKLLLQMVKEGEFSDPFHVFPRSGPLPQLPPHLKLKLKKHKGARRKRAAAAAAPASTSSPSPSGTTVPAWLASSGVAGAATATGAMYATAVQSGGGLSPNGTPLGGLRLPPSGGGLLSPGVSPATAPKAATTPWRPDPLFSAGLGGGVPPSTGGGGGGGGGLAAAGVPSPQAPTAAGPTVAVDAVRRQLDAALELYQTEMARRMDAEARLAAAEATILKQDHELTELRELLRSTKARQAARIVSTSPPPSYGERARHVAPPPVPVAAVSAPAAATSPRSAWLRPYKR